MVLILIPSQHNKLTRGFIYSLVHHMVLLMNPLTVALKIDLCGWACFAVQIHRLVLHNVSLLGFNEEVGQWLWRIRWKSFWKFMKKVVICKGKMKELKFSWQTLAKTS